MSQNLIPRVDQEERLLHEAVGLLKEDGVIIYPTETFFGIGCRYDSEKAISRVFRSKKRLLAMPLPLIIGNYEQLEMVTSPSRDIEADVLDLSSTFWPGPLTLILEARRHLSPLLTGGSGNIAVRISPHPVAQKLTLLSGGPLVSSSANISGQPAVTGAAELNPELVMAVDAVLDLPPSPAGGRASTIVRPLGEKRLELLRFGALAPEKLSEAGYRLESQDSAQRM